MIKMLNYLHNYLVCSFAHLRAAFWKPFLKRMGKDVQIMERVIIMSPQKVEIGNHVFINKDSKIGGQQGIKLGNYVSLAYNTTLVTQNHAYQNHTLPIQQQGGFGGPIEIGDDVWIGANAVILPNVKVGRGAVVGANAVVTTNVKPYSVVAGAPARLIKYRFDKKQIKIASTVDLS